MLISQANLAQRIMWSGSLKLGWGSDTNTVIYKQPLLTQPPTHKPFVWDHTADMLCQWSERHTRKHTCKHTRKHCVWINRGCNLETRRREAGLPLGQNVNTTIRLCLYSMFLTRSQRSPTWKQWSSTSSKLIIGLDKFMHHLMGWKCFLLWFGDCWTGIVFPRS